MTKIRKISITAVLLPLMLIFAMFTAIGCDLFGGMDTKALEAAIAEAKGLHQGTVTDVIGNNTYTNAFWATSKDMATLQAAITAAEVVLDSATTQEEIDDATTTLKAAINLFKNEHRKQGNKPVENPGENPGENPDGRIGEITGTITLTNIPATNRPKVSIRAGIDGAGVSYDSGLSEISLSGVPSNQTEATVNWSIPVYEDEWIPSYAHFSLSITPAGTTNPLYIQITPEDGWAIEIPENHVVGFLGTYSIAAVVLSGTINVNLDGDRVPVVQIRAYSYTELDMVGFAELKSPAANTPWTIVIPSYPNQHEIFFEVTGLRNSWAELFEEVYLPDPRIFAQNSNVSGININLGTKSRGTKLGDLKGTITLTDIKTPRQTVYIDTYYNSSVISLSGVSGTQATLNWSVPVYSDDYYDGNVIITLEVLESGKSDSFTIYLGSKEFNLDTSINLGTVSLLNPDVPNNPKPLTANQWVNGNITKGNIDWYSISVTPGTYNLWWNDSYAGDKTKTADIAVRVFRGTPDNLIEIELRDDDSSWSSPSPITVNFTGTVYVRVNPYYDDGTYGIVYSTANTRPAL